MIERSKIKLNVNQDFDLLGYAWHTDNAVANVIIIEGMEETLIRYDEFARFLCSKGFNVYGVDHFGQGLNVKEDLSDRGVWPTSGFRKMVQAVDALVAKLRVSCRPIYIFAHSMGGYYAQDYIQRYSEHVSKVVLSGTSGKNGAVSFAYRLSKMSCTKKNRNKKSKFLSKLMFGGFNIGIENPKTEYDWLSYNEENVAKYVADPLCGFGSNKGFIQEFLKGLNRVWRKKFLSKINKNIKIFVLCGDADAVSKKGKEVIKLENMYHKVGVKDVRTKIYANARHEVHNECQEKREELYNDVASFFLE